MPLLAAFALANLKSDLAKLWTWLCHRSFWQLVAMGLAAFALVQHFQLADARHDATNYKNQRDEVTRLRTADQTAYRAAQAKAKADNQAQVQKVEAQHEVVTNRIRSDYSRDLQRLRAQARTNPGAAGSAGASGVPQAASGTDGQAGVPLSTPELLRAAEQELQLDKLIDWVSGQSQVDPNK